MIAREIAVPIICKVNPKTSYDVTLEVHNRRSSTDCDLTVHSDATQARHITSPKIDKQHSVDVFLMR